MPGRPRRSRGDIVFQTVLTGFALVIPAVMAALVLELTLEAWPAIRRYGAAFLVTSTWDPVAEVYGAAPMLFGTVVSSLLALLLAVPLAVGTAVFLSEFSPPALRRTVGTLVELLAAIPSVVYGLWGIFVLIPLLRRFVVPVLEALLGWTPLGVGPFYGSSMLAAGFILAIMILPYIATVSREVLRAVPTSQRDAALALGATRWEAVWSVQLPYARTGIMGAVILGLGRALGETMAVTMVIGNRHEISTSLFHPGYTMASVIANEFREATTGMYLSALFEIGLVLFGVTVVINALARLLVWRVARGSAAGSTVL